MEPVPSKFPYPEGTTLACFPKDSPACYFLSPCPAAQAGGVPTAARPPSLCCGAMLLLSHCESPTQPLNICHALQPACKRFLLYSLFLFFFFPLFCLCFVSAFMKWEVCKGVGEEWMDVGVPRYLWVGTSCRHHVQLRVPKSLILWSAPTSPWQNANLAAGRDVCGGSKANTWGH